MHAIAGRTMPFSARLIGGCRRWNVPRTFSPIPSKRSMHVVHGRRELPYPIEDGVGDFLPPDALKAVVEWQDGLLQRLDEQIRGTEVAKPQILQIMIDTVGKREYIRAFNYASLAVNNSFFLDNLKPPGPESNESEISHELKGAIVNSFADLHSLKERFVASAAGMVSSGWLWLVTDDLGRLAVIPTFGVGSLLVRSRHYWEEVQEDSVARQPLNWLSEPLESDLAEPGIFPSPQDGPSPASPVSGVKGDPSKLNPRMPARSFSSSAVAAVANVNYSYPSVRAGRIYGGESLKTLWRIGDKLYPLCCLSLYEHTWISAGLGVWGKEEYARRFFTVVDWKRVSETFRKFRSSGSKI